MEQPVYTEKTVGTAKITKLTSQIESPEAHPKTIEQRLEEQAEMIIVLMQMQLEKEGLL